MGAGGRVVPFVLSGSASKHLHFKKAPFGGLGALCGHPPPGTDVRLHTPALSIKSAVFLRCHRLSFRGSLF